MLALKYSCFILTLCALLIDANLIRRPNQNYRRIFDRFKNKLNPNFKQTDAVKSVVECNNQKNFQGDLCLTEECVHLASKILSKIDKTVNPCHDFFKFSCGKWQENNVHKIDDDNIFYASNLNEMPKEIDTELKGLLSGKKKIYEGFYKSRPYKDLNNFYQSCMNVDAIRIAGFAPAATILRSLSELYVGRPFDPNSFNLTKALVELLSLNSAPLFDISLDTKLNNASYWGLVVSTPRHYGLIQTLVGPKFRLKRKPGVQQFSRSKGRKILKKIIKEMGNDLFVLELLANIQKGKRTNQEEKLDSQLKVGSSSKPQNSGWLMVKPKNKLSFYNKILENESVNKIKNEVNKDENTKTNIFNSENNVFHNIEPNSDDQIMTNDQYLAILTQELANVNKQYLASLNDQNETHPNDAHENYITNEGIIVNPPAEITTNPSGEITTNPSGEITTNPSGEITTSQSGEDTPNPPGVLYLPADDITEIKDLIAHLDQNMIQNINDTFYENAMNNESFMDNISDSMLPAILENMKDLLDPDTLAKLLAGLNESGTDDQFAVLNQNEMTEMETLEMIQMLGILPELSRAEVYNEIQNEVTLSRQVKLSSTIQRQDFNRLLSVSEESANDSSHPNMNQDIIDEILNFVKELKELEPNEREDLLLIQKGKVYNSYTVKELQDAFPFVEWRYLLSELVNQSLSEDDVVQVYYKEYMEKLSLFLRNKEPWLIHHGMVLLFMFDTLNELVTVELDESREEFCYSVMKETMSDVMSHLYLHHIGPNRLQELKTQFGPITEDIRKYVEVAINENNWMTSEDKETAIDKIRKMDIQIGGLDKHLDISYVEKFHEGMKMDESLFLNNVLILYKLFRKNLYSYYSEPIDKAQLIWSFTAQPFTVNAFHLQSTNAVVMPEAFFHHPYFSENSPTYYNYGSAGMAFAHEMIHALDFTGSIFDVTGAVSHPFSANLTDSLRDKIGCFNTMVEEQYYEVGKIEGMDITLKVDTTANMNENIADVSGLNLAYKTYHQRKGVVKDEAMLPGLQQYSPEQLFFIGFAQPYCAILPTIAKVILMEIDEHLPHDIRVNSLMRNSADFAKVFDCKKDDVMHNENTCEVF